MLACVAVTDEGLVDPRCRRAERLAIAKVEGDTTVSREEFAVSWGTPRESGSEPTQQPRVARFLGQHELDIQCWHSTWAITCATCFTAFSRHSHDDGRLQPLPE